MRHSLEGYRSAVAAQWALAATRHGRGVLAAVGVVLLATVTSVALAVRLPAEVLPDDEHGHHH